MSKMKIAVLALAILGCAAAAGRPHAAGPKIYWGNDVPRGWTGDWPEALRTVPERTAYASTTSSLQILEFADALRWKSESVHAFSMYTSPLGRTCPVLVLASPRVTTPAEAVASANTLSNRPTPWLCRSGGDDGSISITRVRAETTTKARP